MRQTIKSSAGFFFVMIGLLIFKETAAQVQNPAMPDTSFGEKVENLRIGGYLDLYYGGFRAGGVRGREVPYFVSMNQTRQVSVNLACLDLRYSSGRIRSRLIPGFGTYMNANYIGEPGGLAYLVEANAGYCVNVKRQIWLDAGVLSSPYSNESCISKDHLMYSRSLAPEYVPYYLSGVKGSMPLGPDVRLSLYFLNGWQQIRDRNPYPAFGTQLEWQAGKRSLINWNTFAGNEQNSEAGIQGEFQRFRWFTDVYWVFNPEGKVTLTSCAYLGLQEYAPGFKRRKAYWWQVNGQIRWRITPVHSLSGRLEYFSDPFQAVAASLVSGKGFEMGSAGLCWNLKAADRLLFRIEYRQFLARESILFNSSAASWLLTGMSVAF